MGGPVDEAGFSLRFEIVKLPAASRLARRTTRQPETGRDGVEAAISRKATPETQMYAAGSLR
jgi:hypothetical protein